LLQQTHVQHVIGHFLLGDQFVLGVNSDLNIVADADLRIGGHGATVGIGQGYLVLAALFERRQVHGVFTALLFQRFDLVREVLDPCAACGALVGIIGRN
jgi:hypothetical protein